MPSVWQKFAQQRYAPAPAKVAALPDDPKQIWRDPDLLWRWTIEMLLATDTSPLTDERAAIFAGQHERRELLQLMRNDPLEFAARIKSDLWRTWTWYLRQRPPGRPSRHQPGLVEAWETAQFIQRMWQQFFGHCRRRVASKSTAVDMAAALHGFTSAELRNYPKNRKPRRPKAT